ncbi:hypothetical protein GQ54DRAFT_306500 [Martensiomyces pterosporus]|nr:hypothetical protein GQ54DRAFT_306500 [Martensiomyces pterosporus]
MKSITPLLVALSVFTSVSSGAPYIIHESGRLHSRQSSTSFPPSDQYPLSDWIGEMYNGLSSIHTTTITDDTLLLRSALNTVAQAEANKLCNTVVDKSKYVMDKDSLLKLIESTAHVSAADAGIVVSQGADSVKKAVSSWNDSPYLKHSNWAVVSNRAYKYVGVGVCEQTWVAVFAGDFK